MVKYRIYWVSKHKPLYSQIKYLEKKFGGVEIVQDPNPFSGAKEIIERYRRSGCNDIVVVAPLSVISKLCELGVKPLYAVMEEVDNPLSADVEVNGRLYKFRGFKRIREVKIVFEEE